MTHLARRTICDLDSNTTGLSRSAVSRSDTGDDRPSISLTHNHRTSMTAVDNSRHSETVDLSFNSQYSATDWQMRGA